MNNVKYRPVGREGPIVVVKVRQRAPRHARFATRMDTQFTRPKHLTVAQADAGMLGRGYVRAGVKHG